MFKYVLYTFIFIEIIWGVKSHNCFSNGSKELYTMLSKDEEMFLDYSNHP